MKSKFTLWRPLLSADKKNVSTAPLTFTGISTFSNDFQTILKRALQIAQIPVTALQNKDSDLLQQKTLLGTLGGAVNGLSASLSSLGTVAASKALAATSSNPAAVTASASSATTAGVYTINSITSAATAASERTTASFADAAATPVSSTGTLQLVVGSQTYTFTLTNNSLIGARDKINSLGAGVTASILTTSGGNYLSISSNTTGATTLELRDDPTGANTNLLSSTNQGANAVFQLNGIDISQPGNVVNNVVPGVTFTIHGASATPITLTLASDGSQLSSALQNFVSNYNAIRTQLNAQVGAAAGLLSGDTVVTQLQTLLRQIAGYRGTGGSVNSLAELGVEFSSTGAASFNASTFSGLTGAQLADGFNYLGSATTGLGAFSGAVGQFSDPIDGLIKVEQDGLTRMDQSLQNQITTLTDRISTLQTNLAAHLRTADAFAAQLQAQQQTLTATLQGLSLVLYGKNLNQQV